ncbi:hypothetical protein D3C74_409170 [compost metagenome]
MRVHDQVLSRDFDVFLVPVTLLHYSFQATIFFNLNLSDGAWQARRKFSQMNDLRKADVSLVGSCWGDFVDLLEAHEAGPHHGEDLFEVFEPGDSLAPLPSGHGFAGFW